MMRKCLKYFKNYQNGTQRHEVSRCCWKKVPTDSLDAGRPQTLTALQVQCLPVCEAASCPPVR